MPVTRNQRKRLLNMVAKRVQVQDVLRLEDEDHLYVFAVRAAADQEVASAVEHLTIELSNAYPLRLLRSTLQLTPNLTDLILTLSTPFPSRLLDELVFNNLRLLKTNLPHCHLVTFLSTNPSIRFLDLGPCGRSQPCPLMVSNLSRIPDIRCPIECAATIVHLGVVRVRADLTRPRTIVSAVLRAFPIAFFTVYTLTLQFNPTDDDILESIARPQTPRPWMHATKLRDNLLKMRFLDHLVVRMTASFVSVPGLAQERTVIFKWMGENTITRKHPCLKFIAVWYRAT